VSRSLCFLLLVLVNASFFTYYQMVFMFG